MSYYQQLASMARFSQPTPDCFNDLFGDETILKQILINLVGNAIKFTDSGSVEASVETFDETQTDVMLRLTVKDSGIGIASEDQATVFSPFFQTKGPDRKGKGLGLHTCNALPTARLLRWFQA